MSRPGAAPSAAASPTARFPRALRLKQRRLLRPLFRKGQSGTVAAGSVRLTFRRVPRAALPHDVPLQVAFVPGRQPTAVVRNRVRRILREVYRRHHRALVDLLALPPAEALTLAVLFRGTPAPDLFARVSADLPRALGRLADALRPALEAPPDGSAPADAA